VSVCLHGYESNTPRISIGPHNRNVFKCSKEVYIDEVNASPFGRTMEKTFSEQVMYYDKSANCCQIPITKQMLLILLLIKEFHGILFHLIRPTWEGYGNQM